MKSELFDSKIIEINLNGQTYQLNTWSVGEGPLILFIHGWGHSGLIWTYIAQALSDQYTCLAIDLPGFGNSSPLTDDQISLDFYAKLIHANLDKITNGREVFAMVGDSMGAITILKLIEENLHLSSRYLFSGCPIDGLPRSVLYLNFKGILSISLKLLQIMPRWLATPILKIFSLQTVKRLKNVDDIIINSVLASDPATAEKLFRQLIPQEIITIDNISEQIQTVIVRGEYDRMVSMKTAQRLSQMLHGELIEIPNSGHTPMIEKVTQYVNALKSLLIA